MLLKRVVTHNTSRNFLCPLQFRLHQQGLRVTTGDGNTCKQKTFRKARADQVQVIQNGNHCLSFTILVVNERHQIMHCRRIDPQKWLIQYDHGCILLYQPGKQHALRLPTRKIANGNGFHSRKPDGCQHHCHARSVFDIIAAKSTGFTPTPHCGHIEG